MEIKKDELLKMEPVLFVCTPVPCSDPEEWTIAYNEETNAWEEVVPVEFRLLRELITCANCKHFRRAGDGCRCFRDLSYGVPLQTEEDNYCKWAEKIEEGE